ncbi:peptidylprolyl isomerase [Aerosakkonema funiforme]|uniref:peptidylprolyl isomerase n=2 Tax=Oscillatoriophycideae TaxID=1301283 RepID=A0A926ZHW0_9CYAN|nr:peptidylprolyl isomerase [Aerosakkonema funiforme]MBD2183743.1 peptidylprolyl isomerase [Aerosakkonema funiforme FACHB-1375]
MPRSSLPVLDALKRWLLLGVMMLLAIFLNIGLSGAGWNFFGSSGRESRLPAGNAITDAKALLRYALPIDNQPVRELQASLEDISTQLRSNRRWSAISSDISKASLILTDRQDQLLASVPEERKAEAETAIADLKAGLADIRAALEAKDKELISQERAKLLDKVGLLEYTMVQKYPFEVPAEYSNLPQLKGRAIVEMVTNKGNLTIVVDGYSAPVTAGNFVDLVQRGFYDGLPFIRAEESYYLQTGDPAGPEQGFIDPSTGKYRAIPLEILVRGDEAPTYGITLEDAGRYLDKPVLPFSAYGALGMARPEFEPNGGSSQFFFFLFEPELTPAGLNLLDGRYAVFGFVIEGKEVLEKLRQGDKIESAKAIEGAENLIQPQVA